MRSSETYIFFLIVLESQSSGFGYIHPFSWLHNISFKNKEGTGLGVGGLGGKGEGVKQHKLAVAGQQRGGLQQGEWSR